MIRSQQIGLALAENNQVSILDGGRPVSIPSQLKPIPVPALARHEGELVSLREPFDVPQAFKLRENTLRSELLNLCPDVIVVEHFPFSKWELAEEVSSLLMSARRVNPAVKILASLRDICLRTRYESECDYEERVLGWLEQLFDGLIVHADPAVCQLGDYFSRADDIAIPVFHSGIVSSVIAPLPPERVEQVVGTDGFVVASVGGGIDQAKLIERVITAWRRLLGVGEVDNLRLLIFSGLEVSTQETRDLVESDDSIIDMGFAPDFNSWMNQALLSISCAGYNTCANLLESRTTALLLPNPAMSDQLERTRLMVRCGVAQSVPETSPDEREFAALIARNLGGTKTVHTVRIDGALESAACIERWASGLPGN